MKAQCYILCASSIIPLLVSVVGFSSFLGWVGVVAYLAFLYYSLASPSPVDDKKEDHDLESK